jgi:hypothetical protein
LFAPRQMMSELDDLIQSRYDVRWVAEVMWCLAAGGHCEEAAAAAQRAEGGARRARQGVRGHPPELCRGANCTGAECKWSGLSVGLGVLGGMWGVVSDIACTLSGHASWALYATLMESPYPECGHQRLEGSRSGFWQLCQSNGAIGGVGRMWCLWDSAGTSAGSWAQACC